MCSTPASLAASACGHRTREDTAFRWTSQLQPGAVVHLRDGAGNLTVRRAAGSEATVTGLRHWRRGRASDVQFEVTQHGNDYYICAMWRGSGKCDASGYRGRHTGGFLSIFSLFHRSTDASAEFVAEVPAGIAVDARTSNGSVQIEGVSSGVTAHSTNGSVEAWNVSGPLSISSTNGNVRVSADSLAPNDAVNLSTTNGTVYAELPAGDFVAQLFSGRLDVSASPNLTWSNFVQYDTDSRILGFQSRIRWILKPGSDLFLVVSRGWYRRFDGDYMPLRLYWLGLGGVDAVNGPPVRLMPVLALRLGVEWLAAKRFLGGVGLSTTVAYDLPYAWNTREGRARGLTFWLALTAAFEVGRQ